MQALKVQLEQLERALETEKEHRKALEENLKLLKTCSKSTRANSIAGDLLQP